MFEDNAGGAGGTGADDKVNEKSSLTKAVEKAVGDATEETTEETTTETTEETTEEETTEEEDEFSEEHLEKAKQLYRALSNPATAKQVVEILATNAGIIKSGTAAEEKKTVKTVTEIIQEGLGDDYKYLGTKLAKLIPAVVEQMVEEKVSDIREKQREGDKKETSQEFYSAFDSLREKYDDFDTYHTDMNKLMDTHPVNDRMSAKEYFEDLYLLAKARKSSGKKSTVTVDKDRLKKSKDNVAARLATGGEVKGSASTSSGQKMTLRESIQAAMDKVANDQK